MAEVNRRLAIANVSLTIITITITGDPMDNATVLNTDFMMMTLNGFLLCTEPKKRCTHFIYEVNFKKTRGSKKKRTVVVKYDT